MADKTNDNWQAGEPAGSWQATEQANGSWQGTGASASWPDSGQEAGDWGYSGGWGKSAACVPNRLAVLGMLLVGAQVAAPCALAAMVITAVLFPLLPRGGHSEEWSG